MKLDASNRPAALDTPKDATCVECGHPMKIHRWNGCHVQIPHRVAPENLGGYVEEQPPGGLTFIQQQCACPGFR